MKSTEQLGAAIRAAGLDADERIYGPDAPPEAKACRDCGAALIGFEPTTTGPTCSVCGQPRNSRDTPPTTPPPDTEVGHSDPQRRKET